MFSCGGGSPLNLITAGRQRTSDLNEGTDMAVSKRTLEYLFFMGLVGLALFCAWAPSAFAGYSRDDQPRRPAVGGQQVYPELQVITTPAAAATTAVLTATNNASTSATKTVTSGITNPDVPRNLTVTTSGTTGDCAAGNVTITGKDALGHALTENLPIPNAFNGTQVGTKAFKSVSSIVLPAEQSTHSCSFAVGAGASLGLNRCLDQKGYLFQAAVNGTRESTFPTMYVNSSSVSGNMAVPNTTPDGTKDVAFMYFQNYRCLP